MIRKLKADKYGRLRRRSSKSLLHARTKGQALLIIALAMMVLILFTGLAVDAGNLMSRRGKLQSAVDAAALSGAQLLNGTTIVHPEAEQKAYQILSANGIYTSTLNMSVTTVTFPRPSQISIHAVQRVDTLFMRIIPMFATMEVSADATADLNSFAEINAKPYGKAGVVNELNLMVWGPASWRQNGDAYSPVNDRDPANPSSAVIANSQHDELPYGYLFRIDVPASYTNNHNRVVVQIFDPDSYNRTDSPPTWSPTATATPYPCPGPLCGTPVPTSTPPTPVPDNFAACGFGGPPTNRDMVKYPAPTGNDPDGRAYCTSTTSAAGTIPIADPGLYRNSFPTFYGARPAFWRVDEYRCPYPNCTGAQYDPSNATTTRYSIWHFNPYITSAFDSPWTLSDQNGPLAIYTGTETTGAGADGTDLKWFQPGGFDIALIGTNGKPCFNGATSGDCFTRESTGGFYFYLYVQGMAGSSENNYDFRVGPPPDDISPAYSSTYSCTAPLSDASKSRCYVNKLYYDQTFSSSVPDWDTKGVQIFAKHSLPVNLLTGSGFPPILTQISKNAAGQVLTIKHFDMDGPGIKLYYQMQKCGATDLNDNNSWADIPNPVTGNSRTWGLTSGSDTWTDVWPGTTPREYVYIPQEGTTAYQTFFGNGTSCSTTTSWLRIQNYKSYSQDTTVWELPFKRPRLIK